MPRVNVPQKNVAISTSRKKSESTRKNGRPYVPNVQILAIKSRLTSLR